MRGHAHEMTDGQATIMSLWDSGKYTIAEIAERTDYAKRYVRLVVDRYSASKRVLNRDEQMVIAGSRALLEAIRLHHPEMVGASR